MHHSIHGSRTPTKHATVRNRSSISIGVKNYVERTTNHATIFKKCSITSVQMLGLKNGKIKWPMALSPFKFKNNNKKFKLIYKRTHTYNFSSWIKTSLFKQNVNSSWWHDVFVVSRKLQLKGRIKTKQNENKKNQTLFFRIAVIILLVQISNEFFSTFSS